MSGVAGLSGAVCLSPRPVGWVSAALLHSVGSAGGIAGGPPGWEMAVDSHDEAARLAGLGGGGTPGCSSSGALGPAVPDWTSCSSVAAVCKPDPMDRKLPSLPLSPSSVSCSAGSNQAGPGSMAVSAAASAGLGACWPRGEAGSRCMCTTAATAAGTCGRGCGVVGQGAQRRPWAGGMTVSATKCGGLSPAQGARPRRPPDGRRGAQAAFPLPQLHPAQFLSRQPVRAAGIPSSRSGRGASSPSTLLEVQWRAGGQLAWRPVGVGGLGPDWRPRTL